MDANARGGGSCKNMSVLFAFKSNFLKTKFDIFHRQVSKMGLQLNTQPQRPILPPYMLCINMTFLKFHGCNCTHCTHAMFNKEKIFSNVLVRFIGKSKSELQKKSSPVLALRTQFLKASTTSGRNVAKNFN